MNLAAMNPRGLASTLKVVSAVSAFELPALALIILAAIPGPLDEVAGGVIALLALGGLTLLRSTIRDQQREIVVALHEAVEMRALATEEFEEASRALTAILEPGDK